METIKTYYGEAGRTVYPVDFNLGYLDRSHIYVYAGEVPTEQLAYSWLNANQIELVTPFTVGAPFVIRRITPRNELFNDYENGAILEERNLDDSFKQTLMVLEEWEEGSFPNGLTLASDIDMQGYRILNLPKPVLPHEPVRLQDVTIDISDIISNGDGGLLRSTFTPQQADGWFWFDKVDGLYVGDEGTWKPVSGTGGGTGGGIAYVDTIPAPVSEGTTYFDKTTLSMGFTLDDSDSTQIIEFDMLGDMGTSAVGGGTAVTLANSAGTGNTLLKTVAENSYEFKRIKQGANITIADDGNEITINATAGGGGTTTTLSNAGSTGLGLVLDPSANNYPIKRLVQGTNVTITDNGTYLTIAAAGGGSGVADGDKGDIVVSSAGAVWTFDPAVVTTFAKTLLDDTTAAGMRTTLGLGTAATANSTAFQAADATLTALAELSTGANQMMYATGADTFAMTNLTSLARTLLANTTFTAMLATLGITVVTNANGVSIRFPTASATSGIQICFQSGLTTGSITTAHGNLFVGAGVQWVFPSIFKAGTTPSVSAFPSSAAAAWIGGGASATTTSDTYLRGFSGVSGTTATFTAMAIGEY